MGVRELSIGMLAKATNTKVETIRFYEKSGLLPIASRTGGNYRTYDTSDRDRLRFIRNARNLGFSLDQVRELLALSDDRTKSCAAVDVIAKEHRSEVERKLSHLQAMKAELDRMIDQCGCGIVADCRIIESLCPVSDEMHQHFVDRMKHVKKSK